MINLHFSLSNPWAKENFKNLWCAAGPITKHKHWELEFIRYAPNLFEVHISYTIRADHAGLKIVLALLGYSVNLNIYDSRHWNYESNSW
jgi:hypothetical protein